MGELIVLVICLCVLAAVLAGLGVLGVYLKIQALLVLTTATVSVLGFWYWRAPERSNWYVDREGLRFGFTFAALALGIVWGAAGFTNWAWPNAVFRAVSQWAIH
jgi:hypothetical protein